jgi:hypothetical protein
MAINTIHNSHVSAKASHTSSKQTRKSPYNTRPPKRPSLPSQDTTHSSDTTLHSSTSLQGLRERSSPSVLVSPPKKGLTVSLVSLDPHEENLSLYPMFTPGFCKKTPARAMFKAARKGKNKLF